MRRQRHILLMILVLILMMALVSCNQSNMNTTPSTEQSSNTENSNQNPAEQPGASKPNLLTLTEKSRIFNGETESASSNTYYGVGRTLNVINDPYVLLSSGPIKIFDADKLLSLNWHKTDVGTMHASSYTGRNMQEFYSAMNEKFQLSFGTGTKLGVFNAGVDADFNFAAGTAYQSTASEMFYTFSQIYGAQLVEIDEYYNLTQFSNILSEQLMNDARAVQNGALTPQSFINMYGTHVVLAGYYGGEVECNYYLRSTQNTWDANYATDLQAKAYAALGNLMNMEAKAGVSIAEQLHLNQGSYEERFSASSKGGAPFEANSITSFLNKYGSWVESINDKNDFGVLVDLPKRSLAAIWDLFPSELNEARIKLEECFQTSVSESNNEFLNKYQRNFTPVDPTLEKIKVYDGVIKSGEYKVNGSGHICSTSFSLNQSISELKVMGYTHLILNLDYQLREEDNCKIYVNLFDENNNSIYYRCVEHGGNTRNQSYAIYTIELEINLNNIPSNKFRLEFKAENQIFKDFYVGLVTGKAYAVQK